MVQLSATFAALADDNRREILRALQTGPVRASALAEPLAMSVTGLLKHVAVLEAAGLVETEKVGRTRVCRLGPARLDDAAGWISDHQRRWDERVDRFDAYLRRAHPSPSDQEPA